MGIVTDSANEAFAAIDAYIADADCSDADKVTLAINKASLMVNFAILKEIEGINRNLDYMLNAINRHPRSF
jgi:hypothetical protein